MLYFPHLAFELLPDERRFLTPAVHDPKARNISLDEHGHLKGARGDAAQLLATGDHDRAFSHPGTGA